MSYIRCVEGCFGGVWGECVLYADLSDDVLGVYAPGYTERRVERIKEAYGIDVTNPTPAVGVPRASQS